MWKVVFSLDAGGLNGGGRIILNSYVFIFSYKSSIEEQLNRESIEVIRKQVE